jgi:predicted secreted acid phosphatase
MLKKISLIIIIMYISILYVNAQTIYDYKMNMIINNVVNNVNKSIINNNSKKFAIVFDIDETSLNNYLQLKHKNFLNINSVWKNISLNTNIPPISQTLFLYFFCIKHNINIFFVSARYPNFSQSTNDALNKAGYITFNELFVLSKTYDNKSFSIFKKYWRSQIEKNEYSIINNIGDQISDIKGNHAIYGYKLPNYIY